MLSLRPRQGGQAVGLMKGKNMITEIERLEKKYQAFAKYDGRYISIVEVLRDIYQLKQDARLKRIPKDQR